MIQIAPHTARGELEVGVERDYPLPHCGLNSPIDIDGSLWEPVGAHEGSGGPLNEAQIGDLINPTTTVVVLTSPEFLQMRTPTGAVVLLARHDGPREYIGCD